MVTRIEHIGVMVRDLNKSLQRYTSLLNLKVEEIEESKVDNGVNRFAFLPVGETRIELIETTAETGLVAEFLKERGEGIHLTSATSSKAQDRESLPVRVAHFGRLWSSRCLTK